MSEKATFVQVHEAYLQESASRGAARSKITDHFTTYLKKNNGKLPALGIPMEEFVRWANMIPTEINPDIARQLMFISSATYTHYVWSFTKASFVIEKELWPHLIEGDAPKVLPTSTLRQLPHWSQWINCVFTLDYRHAATGNKYEIDIEGFWATYVNYQEATHLSLSCFGVYNDGTGNQVMSLYIIFDITKDMELSDGFDWFMHLVGANGATGIDINSDNGSEINEAVMALMKPVVNVLLFVASQVDNIYKGGIKSLKPRRSGSSYKIIPVRDVREWNVGTELLNEIRTYESEVKSHESNGRRAHIRRAHHHSYWYGPLKGERELKSRWVPPCVVRGTIAE